MGKTDCGRCDGSGLTSDGLICPDCGGRRVVDDLDQEYKRLRGQGIEVHPVIFMRELEIKLEERICDLERRVRELEEKIYEEVSIEHGRTKQVVSEKDQG